MVRQFISSVAERREIVVSTSKCVSTGQTTATVQFATSSLAKMAVSILHGKPLGGRIVSVKRQGKTQINLAESVASLLTDSAGGIASLPPNPTGRQLMAHEVDTLYGQGYVVSNVASGDEYQLDRPLDKSNSAFLTNLFDVMGGFAAGVVAAFLESDYYTAGDVVFSPNPNASKKYKDDLEGLKTPCDVLSNPSFDMVKHLYSFNDGIKKYIRDHCHQTQGHVKAFNEGLSSVVAVRNLLYHAAATKANSDGEGQGEEVRPFHKVFEAMECFSTALKQLSGTEDPALSTVVRRSLIASEGLKRDFEHSRIVRRMASDFGRVESNADVKDLSLTLLETLTRKIKAGGDGADELGRLVMGTIGSQVSTSIRAPGLDMALRALQPDNKAQRITELTTALKGTPGLRFEFYAVALFRAAHCTSQTCIQYPQTLAATVVDVVESLTSVPHADPLAEFNSCLKDRKDYHRSLYGRVVGHPRREGLRTFMAGVVTLLDDKNKALLAKFEKDDNSASKRVQGVTRRAESKVRGGRVPRSGSTVRRGRAQSTVRGGRGGDRAQSTVRGRERADRAQSRIPQRGRGMRFDLAD
ncbi:hypothetical protein KIPB_001909 [Kipferlia bialata]|uniref:Uncharacterized protein n=1 Tax=Kipferlia bialata TaxID=797122 RepID=A0A9K3CQN0_9EUKA|nr:hypothetical protein KIPB_001909 [Kipferlia bialata]|eukprot:g1909.t1